MDENDLLRIAGTLGNRAAARIDAERVATAVVSRLRSRPAAPWWASPALIRLAAAVTISVGGGLFAYRFAAHTWAVAATPSAPVTLQPLSNTELEEVLDSLSVAAPAFEGVSVGLPDLNDEQLRALLRKMEG